MVDVPEGAPGACPGTSSDQAGKSSACAGCPNQQICASVPSGPDPDLDFIAANLSEVKHKIVILSGKGGVGKSTFTANLSYALAADDLQVGVIDTDISGPSLPRIFGAMDSDVHQSASGWSPIYVADNIAVMSVGFLLSSDSDAVIFRGPRKNGLIKQFMKNVFWDEIDYMLFDTPPGTSDEHLSVVTFLEKVGCTGAVIVTTPQKVALDDVRKEINFCKKVKLPIIGIVENMSVYSCPKCSKDSTIFPNSQGDAVAMCQEMKVDYLGNLPLDPRLGKASDMGENLLEEESANWPIIVALRDVCSKIKEYCSVSLETK